MAKVGVVGLGRVGLAAALCLRRAGNEVWGYDKNQELIRDVAGGTLHSPEPEVDALLAMHPFHLSGTLEALAEAVDIVFIYVDTPNGGDQAYDHSKLGMVLSALNKVCRPDQHVVICCTVMPGYIGSVGSKLLTVSSLSYNPSFIAQGSIVHDFTCPSVILIGEGSLDAGNMLQDLYVGLTETGEVRRMTPASAEIAKLALNCFVTMKIAYANAIADIAVSTPGASAKDILGAVGADYRVGSPCLKPGYGFGGPCFPRDNRALGMYAMALGLAPNLMIATDVSNTQHAQFQADHLEGDDFVFTDVAYKPGCAVPIIEHSQKLAVAKILADKDKKVTIKDRAVVLALVRDEFGEAFAYEEL
jgi:nucleotide sugar dehydrogenase